MGLWDSLWGKNDSDNEDDYEKVKCTDCVQGRIDCTNSSCDMGLVKIAEAHHEKCSTCRGSSRITCPTCNGNRYILVPKKKD